MRYSFFALPYSLSGCFFGANEYFPAKIPMASIHAQGIVIRRPAPKVMNVSPNWVKPLFQRPTKKL